MDFIKATEHRQHFVDETEVGGGESGRVVSRHGKRIDLPVGEDHRHGDIVGHPFRPQIGKDRKIVVAFRADPPSHTTHSIEDAAQRAILKRIALRQLMGNLETSDLRILLRPGIIRRRQQRMQCADDNSKTSDGHTTLPQTLDEPTSQLVRGRRLPCLPQEPINKRVFPC